MYILFTEDNNSWSMDLVQPNEEQLKWPVAEFMLPLKIQGRNKVVAKIYIENNRVVKALVDRNYFNQDQLFVL